MPKIVDHDKRREEILNACFSSFAQRGYAAVTMRDLAKVAGVSTGTLYHYFPTKKDIFKQMFQHMTRQDTLRATQETSSFSPGERLDALMLFMQDNEEYFQNVLMMALEFMRHAQGDVSHAFVNELVMEYQTALEAILEMPLPGMGSVLFSFLMGWVAQRKLAPDTVHWEYHLHWVRTLLETFRPQMASSLAS